MPLMLFVPVFAYGGQSLVNGGYTAGATIRTTCQSACTAAQVIADPSQSTVTVDCVEEWQVTPYEAPSLPPPPSASFALSDFVAGPFISTAGDSSGITYLPNGNLMITLQTQLQVLTAGGQVLSTRSASANDIEGLEWVDGKVLAANEDRGLHMEYAEDGTQLDFSALPFNNIECVAHLDGVTYYGTEHDGQILDASGTPFIDLGKDLAGCTFSGGYLLAITSHAYRDSTWHKVDTETWTVVDQRPLPDGNWEGISCRGNRCVVIREESPKSASGFQIYDRQ